MPGPKDCAARGLKKGTKEYNDCINYAGKYASPVKGSLKNQGGLKKPAGGGY